MAARLLSRLALLLALGLAAAAEQTGNHPEWPRWCGKAYKPEYPSFEPGGQTVEPPALPGGPALDVQFRPRYSLYLESEQRAEFVVDAAVSSWFGQPWPGLRTPHEAPPPPVRFTIALVASGHVLVDGTVAAGSVSNVFAFSLTGLEPRLAPYAVVLTADGAPGVTAASELLFLPEKKDGSVAKLDNLNGGLLFRGPTTRGCFEPFLPYGFYASCDNFLCDKDSVRKVTAYRDLGLNSMVSLTTIAASRPVYEYLDSLDLRFMYDLRSSYKNLTAVREQVSAIKDFAAIYSYWGSDEPDGHQDPFDLVVQARKAIGSIDPYHPVSVTLNCQNYYFGQYTAGADLIMEDAYPIGINSTFSKWGTPCNATYGDCGCDNCRGDVHDVSRRLDDLARYERWLGLWPKTKAHNPQSFHGEGYWLRDPTPDEAVAMTALALHHGAKAIASWVWPTSEALARVHGRFATAVARGPVRDVVVQGTAQRVEVEVEGSEGRDVVDAACWTWRGQTLLSVVNGGHEPVQGQVTVRLPASVAAARPEDGGVVWGNGTWTVGADKIGLGNVAAMSTNMVMLRGDQAGHAVMAFI